MIIRLNKKQVFFVGAQIVVLKLKLCRRKDVCDEIKIAEH